MSIIAALSGNSKPRDSIWLTGQINRTRKTFQDAMRAISHEGMAVAWLPFLHSQQGRRLFLRGFLLA